MITQFSVSFSRTINLGNFESCRVEASVTVAVPELDANNEDTDISVVAAQAQVELRKLLEDTFRAQYTDRQKSNTRSG